MSVSRVRVIFDKRTCQELCSALNLEIKRVCKNHFQMHCKTEEELLMRKGLAIVTCILGAVTAVVGIATTVTSIINIGAKNRHF